MARDLEMTFRDGRLMAAYFHLQSRNVTEVARSKRAADGMVVDFAADNTPMGIEFVAPSKVSLGSVNQLLVSIGQSPASADELWPILRPLGVNYPAA
jgi:hypothetical protein